MEIPYEGQWNYDELTSINLGIQENIKRINTKKNKTVGIWINIERKVMMVKE